MATDTLDHSTHDDHDHGPITTDWSGGNEPWKASYGKLMMWYFLVSDAFTFAGFLITYGTMRVMSPTWPVPDFVFSTAPFGIHDMVGGQAPLIFVTFMSFLLIISSVTMVRAVQEGHRENKQGVAFWMFLTIIGGAGFLGCQAWEWNNLINTECMTITQNPFGSHVDNGVYLDEQGKPTGETFEVGETYLIHHSSHAAHGEGHGEAGHDDHSAGHHAVAEAGDFPGHIVDEKGFILKKFMVTDEGPNKGAIYSESFGPKAFGGLFFFITGFHGFHVLSGVLLLLIIMINVMSGLYEKRRNGYEMVEKIGLYWHFVDLVWVFVFLVFYLL